MIREHTGELLQWLHSVDNRGVDDHSIEAMHALIGHLDFKDARMALVSARQDSSVGMVTGEDILRHHKIIKSRVAAEGHADEAIRRVAAAPKSAPKLETSAPKPNNWTEMCAAYDAGDQAAVNREVAVYKAQLADAGYSTDWAPAPALQPKDRRAVPADA